MGFLLESGKICKNNDHMCLFHYVNTCRVPQKMNTQPILSHIFLSLQALAVLTQLLVLYWTSLQVSPHHQVGIKYVGLLLGANVSFMNSGYKLANIFHIQQF